MNQISDLDLIHTPQYDDDVTIQFISRSIIGFSSKGVYRWRSGLTLFDGRRDQPQIVGVDIYGI